MLERFSLAWSRGDLRAWLSLMDPEVEWAPTRDEAGHAIFPSLEPVYRGHEGIRRHWHDWRSGFEGGVTAEVIGVVYGTGCAVALNRFSAVGRGGVTAEREVAGAIEIRDGLVRRWHNFVRWEDALEALGMPTDLVPGPA